MIAQFLQQMAGMIPEVNATTLVPNAKNYDKRMANMAMQLSDGGMEDNEIHKTTGYVPWKDEEGKGEAVGFIDDTEMELMYSGKEQGITSLGKLVQHKKLFDEYPEMKDTTVYISDTIKFPRTYTDGSIGISPLHLNSGGISNVLHELNHNVNRSAGYEPGMKDGSIATPEEALRYRNHPGEALSFISERMRDNPGMGPVEAHEQSKYGVTPSWSDIRFNKNAR